MLRSRRGFTLIELLIVIAILLAIGGLVVVNLIPRGEQAKTDLQRVQLKQISDAFEHFRLDMDRWPTEEEGLESLWNKDSIQDEKDQQRWRGPYLTEPLRQDRWGHDLIYRFPGELRGEAYYDLVCIGPDGEEKTADDITCHDARPGEQGELAKDSDFGAPKGTGANTAQGASPGGT
jgi:general secretion pathway protein G